MSLKEFFSQQVFKPSVIEFLKNHADFHSLPLKNKKPFRGHIEKCTDLKIQRQKPNTGPKNYKAPFNKLENFASENPEDGDYSD